MPSMWRNRALPLLCTVAALVSAIAIVPIRVQAASELEQRLRDQYKGKTLLLRNFFDGSSLHYDASGQLSGSATSGDWTVDGVIRVEDLWVSGHRLNIRATRLRMGWIRYVGFSSVPAPAGKTGEDYEKAKALHIEANFSPSEVTADGADALLGQMFLGAQDHLPELVPDYWKPCVVAALEGTTSKQYPGCQFSPEFRAVPGVDLASDAGQDLASPEPRAFFRAGSGVAPPRPLSTHEPEFTDTARQAKYQGVVTLGLVVNQEGLPTKIHIVNPLGCGLDAKAVQAVATWRFKPAEKDGQPVAVEIAVEVDFHLY